MTVLRSAQLKSALCRAPITHFRSVLVCFEMHSSFEDRSFVEWITQLYCGLTLQSSAHNTIYQYLNIYQYITLYISIIDIN